jgi:arginine N-succinyltransferase
MTCVRLATEGDLDGLHQLAEHLDTINLPNDRTRLATMLEASNSIVCGKEEGVDRAILFVLEDDDGALVGCSAIIPRHGSPAAPHTFFDVIEDERYSRSLDRVFRHQVLRLGTSFHPRTEIGSLVLAPDLRGRGLGRLISHARFQYIAANRSRFCDHILAELLPPFDANGSSPLWQALGSRFTGMSYREADRMSTDEKEFIEDLFPRGDIHVSLFEEETRAVIGQVGEQTKSVQAMLEAEGFFYTQRIDPFDGGPHFRAVTDAVRSVAATRSGRLAEGKGSTDAIVGTRGEQPESYRAVRTRVTMRGPDVLCSSEAIERLGVKPGAQVLVTPL